MDYAELPLPPALDGLVAAVWTATVTGAEEWVAHEAAPDGCVELIRRHAGRSIWRSEQPPLFATGLNTVPVRLSLGSGARFTGVKLWPWAWHALGGPPCTGFFDRWIAIDEASPLAALLPDDDADIPARLAEAFAALPDSPLRAVLGATSVAGIARRMGLSHRQLQRMFTREIGLPPRQYLRFVRFRGAMLDVQESTGPLADTAAAQGFADQAHMAREFRALAGIPPSKARVRSRGPFV